MKNTAVLVALLFFILILTPGTSQALALDSKRLTEHLPDSCVTRICFDGRLVWVGTSRGLATFDPALNEWRSYGRNEGLDCPFVTAILPVGTDEAWIGTSFLSGAGLFHCQNGRFTKQKLPGAEDIHITALGLMNDQVYAGSFGRGLFKLTPDSAEQVSRTGNFITDISALNSSLYAASKYSGVFHLQNGTIEVIDDHTSVLLHNSVGAVLACATAEVWFGCWGGAARIKDNIWTTYFRHPQQLSHPHVTCLAADDINVYLGTDAGVSVFNRTRETFIHLTGDEIPLPSERIYTLCKVGNHLWIGTDKGLIRIGIR